MRRWLLALILSLLAFTQASASQINAFWAWFAKNEAQYRTQAHQPSGISPDLRNALSVRLGRVHPDLTFELGAPASGPAELIISGDGLRVMIPIVQSVVAGAPVLPEWRIIAFRPRVADPMAINLRWGTQIFAPADIWFHHRIEGGQLDLELFHLAADEDRPEEIAGPMFILLDTMLGEYDVMTGIRYLDFRTLPADPAAAGLRPFRELREIFDQAKAAQK